jgi:Sulfotransferase family
MRIADAIGQITRYGEQGVRESIAIAAARVGAAADRWSGKPDAAALRYGYLVRNIQLARESMATYRRLARLGKPADFELRPITELQRFVLFIGYSRSGHSLVAALLDAHPNVVVSHELHAVKHLKTGSAFADVAHAVQLNSCYFNHFGRGYTGYDYRVPGQYQGRCTELKVLGDKKANGTCRALLKDPELVSWLERTIPVPVTFIHVIRNPWDNIASKARRTGMSLDGAADSYLRNAAAIHALRRRYPQHVIDIYLDELSAAPIESLRRMVGRLGIDADEKYFADCAAIVFQSPRQTQREFDWPPALRVRIAQELRRIDHLSRFADAA